MNIPSGYKVEKYESINAISSEFKNIAKVMEKNGWVARVVLRKGSSFFTANVSKSGKLGKRVRVPS